MVLKLKFVLLTVIFFLYGGTYTSAQNAPPPPENAPPPPGLQLPIDDHIWILFTMGMGLGIYYWIKKSLSLSKT
ncbi:hypothetical protein [Flavimarina sp. Hel_I_48]|uniref:hypothetical protein n=1 Tax=Flavimarina sp. Hel_I_48 TaxID=1392488 RepID=UPI0004DF6888|nr:hypothetical protein [Flavimarina sp. Hel_I_48]